MLNNMIKYNVDIVRCNYQIIKNKQIINSNVKYENQVIYQKELINDYMFKNIIWNSVWGQLIKKDCIKDVIFEDFRIGEDLLFNFQIYKKIKKLYFTSEILYDYYYITTGITKLLTKENIQTKLNDNVIFWKKIFEELENECCRQIIINKCIKMTITYQLQLIFLDDNEIKKMKEVFSRNNLEYFLKKYNGKKYKRLVKCLIKKQYVFLKIYCLLYYKPLKKLKEKGLKYYEKNRNNNNL